MGRKQRQRRVVVTEDPQQDAAPVRSEPPDPALGEVWAWCKENGLKVNKLWPGHSASGRGLHATEGVKRGDLLLQVPAALLFNTRSVRSDKVLGPALHEAAASSMYRLNPLATLCFGLIYERALGAQSWWWPMLASFPEPEEMVTAEQFTAQELRCVPWAAALHEEHQRQTHNISIVTDQINTLLAWVTRNEAVSPALRVARLSRYRGAYGAAGISWAWSVVSTRACFMNVSKYQTNGSHVDTEDTSTLVPWLDLLNHNSAVCISCCTPAVRFESPNQASLVSTQCGCRFKPLYLMLRCRARHKQPRQSGLTARTASTAVRHTLLGRILPLSPRRRGHYARMRTAFTRFVPGNQCMQGIPCCCATVTCQMRCSSRGMDSSTGCIQQILLCCTQRQESRRCFALQQGASVGGQRVLSALLQLVYTARDANRACPADRREIRRCGEWLSVTPRLRAAAAHRLDRRFVGACNAPAVAPAAQRWLRPGYGHWKMLASAHILLQLDQKMTMRSQRHGICCELICFVGDVAAKWSRLLVSISGVALHPLLT
eukprot:COSAG02_NODE_677_length_18591_cov_105.949221_6_plen_545_part_00